MEEVKKIDELSLEGTEFEVSKENGVANIKATDEKLYVEKAKEVGISKKTLEETAKFDEVYLNKAFEEAVAEAEKVMKEDKDIKEAEIQIPFGVQKSSKVKTYVVREKTHRIPGKDETVTKPQIKVVVESHRYNITTSKRKSLENKLKETLLNG